MYNKVLKLDPQDNLVIALDDLQVGETVCVNDGESYTIQQRIPAKHKFVTKNLKPDEDLFMYGVLIGKSLSAIPKGSPIGTHNVRHKSSEISVQQNTYTYQAPDISKWRERTFMGYKRSDGKVGTANYWLVAPLVFCENRNIEILKESLLEPLGFPSAGNHSINIDQLINSIASNASDDEIESISLDYSNSTIKNKVFENIDGIKFLPHQTGCGGTRGDAEMFCELLAGYITNPNVAGATILSLGCQNAQIPLLQNAIERRDPSFDRPVYILEQQASTGERDFLASAIKKTIVGLRKVNNIKRQPAPLSELTVGLECGGSDGFSGLSANPALGYASDLLAALGGSPVLAEFPELNGVEQQIIDRCIDQDLAVKFNGLMTRYGQLAIEAGSGFEANPSPGNIKDGLITDAMKSAGAAKKGGKSPVVDVLDYGQPVVKKGLNLLNTPGNDVESTTGLVGSGCNVVVFTTGLGTPTGNPIAPVIKVSSNTKMAEKLKDIIDINAGTIISGHDTIESKGEEILEHIIQVASGEKVVKADTLLQDDFIPWKRDISL